MAIDISSIQTFTDSELLILYRWGLANNAAGQTKSINGRSVSFPPVEEMRRTVDWLESRIQADASTEGANIALIAFDDPA
jgi:hypothetical protein